MSASPFQQGAPLDDYCKWLIGEGGAVEKGENEWGGFRRLISPDKARSVIVSEPDPDETLLPSIIDNVDSRLGVTSPWRIRSGGDTD